MIKLITIQRCSSWAQYRDVLADQNTEMIYLGNQPGEDLTEECFQRHPLKFDTGRQVAILIIFF